MAAASIAHAGRKVRLHRARSVRMDRWPQAGHLGFEACKDLTNSRNTAALSSLSQCLQISCYILRLRIGESKVRHRCLRLHRAWRHHPPRQVCRIIGEDSADIGPHRHPVERRPEYAVRAADSGNDVAGSAAVLGDYLYAMTAVAAGGHPMSAQRLAPHASGKQTRERKPDRSANHLPEGRSGTEPTRARVQSINWRIRKDRMSPPAPTELCSDSQINSPFPYLEPLAIYLRTGKSFERFSMMCEASMPPLQSGCPNPLWL